MYIGSVSEQRQRLWLYDAATGRMVWREDARYVPGRSRSSMRSWSTSIIGRDPAGTDRIDVTIDAESGRLSVTNTGRGIPVERWEGEAGGSSRGADEVAEGAVASHVGKARKPEVVLSFTGSNRRRGAADSGWAAWLAPSSPTSSPPSLVETVDTAAGLHYQQRWERNMSVRHEPALTKLDALTEEQRANLSDAAAAASSALPRDFRVTFVPDFGRFARAR